INWISSIEQSKYNLDLSKLKRINKLIDDDIIFDNLLLEDEFKILLLTSKYDHHLNEDLMDKLSLNTVFIDVYDIISNELNILAHLNNISERDVKVYVNGNPIPIKKIRFPQNDNYSLGIRYLYDYSLEAKIPLSTDKKYEIEFKSKNKKLTIDFSRPCNFSKKIGYAKTKHYLSLHENNKITIKKKNGLSWILQEAKAAFKLIKNRDFEFIKAFPFRLAYMLGYPFLKNKRIWFYMDRPDESDDNGLHLFKYAVKQDDGISRFFILSKKNNDYEEIKKIGKVIPYKSIRHRYLGLFVENIITSHPDNEIIYPFWGGYPYFAGLLKSNNVFLQHGILKDNISPWLNKSNMNLSFFLVSSTKEFSSIFNYPYNYSKKVVQLKGLPRYDNLKNIKDKKQIIIMPSWRRNLTRKSHEYIQETEYFQRFNSLINNEKLIQKAKEHNYEIIFRPHPNVYNFIELYDENDYVKIDYDKTKFQVLFNNGSLMVTDFSSVAFDFAYLNKPVIYYQYAQDYHFNRENSFYDYETMGFGEICKKEDEIVDLIIEYMENDCKIKEMYQKRIDEFFIFKDRNNCKRVHEAIKKIPLKD
uniref:CDP-glycerol glycerophosphotransferase family protein n=1 Tax=Methanobrevibacter sp. TaxID=66852 RepID=UPI00388F38C8